MNLSEFAKKFGLSENFSIELEMSSIEFEMKFRELYDAIPLSIIDELKSIFKRKKNRYFGNAAEGKFAFENRSSTDRNALSRYPLKGSYIQTNETLKVEGEIQGISTAFIIYTLAMPAISILFFAFPAFDNNPKTHFPLRAIAFPILFVVIFLVIMVLNVKSGLKRIKQDYERELFYMTKFKSK